MRIAKDLLHNGFEERGNPAMGKKTQSEGNGKNIAQRIFNLALDDLRTKLEKSERHDETSRTFHMDTSELVAMFQSEGVEESEMYAHLEKVNLRLMGARITIEDEDGFEIRTVFEKIGFDEKEGLNIEFGKNVTGTEKIKFNENAEFEMKMPLKDFLALLG